MRGRRKTAVWAAGLTALATVTALALVLVLGGSEHEPFRSKFAGGDPDKAQASNAAAVPGEGPADGWDAYLEAAKTYPAEELPPAVADKAETTFEKIRDWDAEERRQGLEGPQVAAVRPDEGRDPAGCDGLLGGDEQHGEPRHGPPGLPRLRLEGQVRLPRLGRSLRRRRLANG